MLILNLKARIKNINWWIGIISTLILIGKYFNFDITDYIGKDWQTLVGLVFGLLALLGITVDTSTKGINDNIPDITIQAINNQEGVKVEGSTVSINNKVTENSQVNSDNSSSSNDKESESTSLVADSANSKNRVDNPENSVSNDANVNAVSADSPTV